MALIWFLLVAVQLFDVVYREETLLNVMRSVTRNGRSIILTAVLALILVYMFSIIGFILFRDDFLVEVDVIPPVAAAAAAASSAAAPTTATSTCPTDGLECPVDAHLINAIDLVSLEISLKHFLRSCDLVVFRQTQFSHKAGLPLPFLCSSFLGNILDQVTS